jgi:hypothetical protein
VLLLKENQLNTRDKTKKTVAKTAVKSLKNPLPRAKATE